MADFPKRELIIGLTTVESYLDMSAQDLEFGFNETRRDRILRTYVRNVYHYHLNEIFSALKVSRHKTLSIYFFLFLTFFCDCRLLYVLCSPADSQKEPFKYVLFILYFS